MDITYNLLGGMVCLNDLNARNDRKQTFCIWSNSEPERNHDRISRNQIQILPISKTFPCFVFLANRENPQLGQKARSRFVPGIFK